MSRKDLPDRIVVRCTEKGTKTILESLKPMKWAGAGFKKSQEKKLGKIKGLKIESAKGTSQIEFARMQRTAIPSLEGRYISSKRGTELLKL